MAESGEERRSGEGGFIVGSRTVLCRDISRGWGRESVLRTAEGSSGFREPEQRTNSLNWFGDS